MEVTYELRQRDFYDSLIAHRNRSALTKWGNRMLSILAVVVVTIGLVGLFVQRNSQALSNLAGLSVLAGFWLALVWALPWWNAKAQFAKQPSAQGPRKMILDDVGIHWQWNGGSAEINWANFVRWVESDSEVLIYSSPVCFNMIPKRALSPTQLTDLRTRLSQHLSPQG